ncbi:MAG: hypothetical protein JKY37_13400 [Nannocystaceae bacterium]|nr:hypothetical protein [Nannocystaceae bacterium]
MPAAHLLVLALAAVPDPEEERLVLEAGVAAAVLYPRGDEAPRRHVAYGVAVSAVFHAESNFKAMVGLGLDHVVNGWLGDPAGVRTPRDGRWVGTQPRHYRGQLLRATPTVRIGVENDFAFGYFGASPGYAIRTASLLCVEAPCRRTRAVDHGITFGVSLGAIISPSPSSGVVIGAEVGLDWAWFPKGHPGLARWNQAMSARLIAGWRF